MLNLPAQIVHSESSPEGGRLGAKEAVEGRVYSVSCKRFIYQDSQTT